jgi:hypothetical protein
VSRLGLFRRREVLLPTWRGWLVALLLGALVLAAGLRWTAPFLAPVQPLHGAILVVEGWLPDYALLEAKRSFESRSYRQLLVTGVPIDQGFHISTEKNYAELAARTLRHLGVKAESIVPVSCPEVPRDRTYATAVQVRAWLEKQGESGPVDVLSLGVHARRTWLMYRLALGKTYPVGVIATADQRYDQRRWWNTSSGFRTVTSEVIAYLYAKLLFFPPATPPLPSSSLPAREPKTDASATTF